MFETHVPQKLALVAALAIAGVLPGCKRGAPGGSSPDDSRGESCQHITLLAQVMKCEMAPFVSGKTHDEAAFRKAVTQLGELVPSDAAFYGGNGRPGWPAITQTMLQSRDYGHGCKACHQAYQRMYRDKYKGQEIPWTDVHAAVSAAK